MTPHASSARWAVPLGALALLLAACGSSPTSSADWKAPEDVIGAISAAKLPCRASGEPTIDTSSESKGYAFIACDDYGVVLITDTKEFDAVDRGNCTRLDPGFLSTAGKQQIVVGPTFRIASVAKDGTFPPSVTAEALAKGLGGTATTLGDYYGGICALVKPSSSASSG